MVKRDENRRPSSARYSRNAWQGGQPVDTHYAELERFLRPSPRLMCGEHPRPPARGRIFDSVGITSADAPHGAAEGG